MSKDVRLWTIKQSFLSTFSKRNTASWEKKKKEKEKGIKTFKDKCILIQFLKKKKNVKFASN